MDTLKITHTYFLFTERENTVMSRDCVKATLRTICDRSFCQKCLPDRGRLCGAGGGRAAFPEKRGLAEGCAVPGPAARGGVHSKVPPTATGRTTLTRLADSSQRWKLDKAALGSRAWGGL